MNTTHIILALAIANLAVSIYYGIALVKAVTSKEESAAQPGAQTRGIGGGGAMRR